MIQGHEKFRVPDENGKNEFFVEVNWKPDDEKTNHCKILKITFPNGENAFIKRENFHSILFAVSEKKEQQDMIPTAIERVRWYETVLSVKAQKDIKKGENITFPIKITLPADSDKSLTGISYKKPLKGIAT